MIEKIRLTIGACRDQGSAIILVVIMLSLLAFIPIGMSLLNEAHKSVKQQLSSSAQADNVARAGLTRALAYFRRQGTVTAYSPTAQDSIAPAIGLVDDYPVGSLRARYEVPATGQYAAQDVSAQRGGLPAGSVWYLQSRGYVYRCLNPSVAFNVAPNVIVGRARVTNEIRHMSLTVPAAAVVIPRGSNVAVGTKGVISGNRVAVSIWETLDNTNFTGTGTVYPTQRTFSSTPLTPQAIFGMTLSDLRMLADVDVPDVISLPNPYPVMDSLVVIEGNAVFTPALPLAGANNAAVMGVLYVTGNLTIQNNSNPNFMGIIYVGGTVTITGQASIRGTVVVANDGRAFSISSPTSEQSRIDYDASVINMVTQYVGQYRENKATFFSFSGGS